MRELRRAIDRTMALLAAPLCERVIASRHLTVLAYHGVDDAEPFERQITWLSENRTLVTADQAQAIVLGQSPPIDRATLITFDDGETSVHDRALPVLIAHDAPAVVFIVSSLVGTDTPFWWTQVEQATADGARSSAHDGLTGRALVRALKTEPDDVRRHVIKDLRTQVVITPQPQLNLTQLKHLQSNQVAIGNHTRSHPCLHNCTPEVLEAEIVGAADDLEHLLGTRPALFAYPNGDHDARCDRLLRAAGHQIALLFDHRLAAVPSTDPLRVSRVRVNAHDSLERFRSIVSGAHPLLHHSLGRS